MKLTKSFLALAAVFSVLFIASGCSSDESAQTYPLLTSRVVVDQLGRSVVVPYEVTSVAVSRIPMITMVAAAGGADLLTGIGGFPAGRSIFETVAPHIEHLPRMGSNANVNFEEVAAVNPDVFIMSIIDSHILEYMEVLGIPIVVINPEDFETLPIALDILGQVFNNLGHTDIVISLLNYHIAAVRQRVEYIADEARTAMVFAANITNIVANDMIQAEILRLVGLRNAAEEFGGTNHINLGLEEVLAFNPNYIFIAAWSNLQPIDFFEEPAFAELYAVQNGNVFKFPSELDWWDTPSPAAGIGAMWALSRVRPDLVSESELDEAVFAMYYLLYGLELGRDFLNY